MTQRTHEMAADQSGAEDGPPRCQRHLVPSVAAGLFALAVLAFWTTLKNGFITFDDVLYITGNPHVQEGFTRQNIAWAFKTMDGGIWHPLTWLSIMLDCQI